MLEGTGSELWRVSAWNTYEELQAHEAPSLLNVNHHCLVDIVSQTCFHGRGELDCLMCFLCFPSRLYQFSLHLNNTLL